MTGNWEPNIKGKPQIDIYHPSFPWRDGKPSWSDYYANIRAEKEDREMRKYQGKGRTRPAMDDKCCFPDANKHGRMCAHKALGKAAIKISGRDVLVPLCEKHRQLLEATAA